MGDKILHFLKEFPAWVVLLFVLLVFFGFYKTTPDDALQQSRLLERLTDGAFAALLLALNVRKQQTEATTQSGDVTVNASGSTTGIAAEAAATATTEETGETDGGNPEEVRR